MPNIGPMELAVVLVIALLILGPKRLPDAGRALGRGLTEFREGLSGRREKPEAIEAPTVPAERSADTSAPVTRD